MLHVFMPACPAYRAPFYSRLLDRLQLRHTLHLHHAKIDTLGVKSVHVPGALISGDLEPLSLFKGNLVWFRNLKISLCRSDIVICIGNPRILNIFPLLLRCKLLGIPFVFWAHGFSADSIDWRYRIRKLILKTATKVILYTDAERARFIADGFPEEKLASLNNGIDTEAVSRAIESVSPTLLSLHKRTHRLDSRRWLLFIGRLTPKAKLDLALQSLTHTKGNVGLIIIGDGPERARLTQYASDAGIADRIRWVGALFDESDLAPWFLAADVFVYCGAVGLSLIHAFAYRLPAIVHGTISSHMPEIAAFKAGINGEFFCKDDPLSLASVIDTMFGDPGNIEKLSEGAAATVRNTYNTSDMADRFITAIDSIPNRTGRTLYGIVKDIAARFINLVYPAKWEISTCRVPPLKPGAVHALRPTKQQLTPPRFRYWADPMPFSFEGRKWVIFEDYNLLTGIGSISACTLSDAGQLEGPVHSCIQEDFHLSFPFVFSIDETTYCIPETSSQKCIRLYRMGDNPSDWQYIRTLATGASYVDTSCFLSDLGLIYLFTSIDEPDPTGSRQGFFEVYRIRGSIETGPIEKVSERSRRANDVLRGGGAVYHKSDLSYLRPTQDCSNSYGERVIMLNGEITAQGSISESIESAFELQGAAYSRMHTMALTPDYIVLDYYERRLANIIFVNIARLSRKVRGFAVRGAQGN